MKSQQWPPTPARMPQPRCRPVSYTTIPFSGDRLQYRANGWGDAIPRTTRDLHEGSGQSQCRPASKRREFSAIRRRRTDRCSRGRGWLGSVFGFLPRITPMHANAGAWAWVLILSWHRRPIHGFAVPWACVPRAASGRGRLSRQAWNASPSSASIWRLKLWAIHPFHRRSSSWDFRQGTEPYACEQAGLHGASSLAEWRTAKIARKARPSGRRGASRTAILRPTQTSQPGDSHSRLFAFIRGKKLLLFSSCTYRKDFAIALHEG